MTWLCYLLAGLPVGIFVEDRVDVIEINHVLDGETGDVRMDVALYWEVSVEGQHVVDWRMLRGARAVAVTRDQMDVWRKIGGPPPIRRWLGCSQEPLYDRGLRRWVSVWRDGHLWRRVQARSYWDSWTPHDPEVADRAPWPESQRRGLRPGRCER